MQRCCLRSSPTCAELPYRILAMIEEFDTAASPYCIYNVLMHYGISLSFRDRIWTLAFRLAYRRCCRPTLASAALLVSNFGRYVFGPFRIAVSKPIIMQPYEVPHRLSSNCKTLDWMTLKLDFCYARQHVGLKFRAF